MNKISNQVALLYVLIKYYSGLDNSTNHQVHGHQFKYLQNEYKSYNNKL